MFNPVNSFKTTKEYRHGREIKDDVQVAIKSQNKKHIRMTHSPPALLSTSRNASGGMLRRGHFSEPKIPRLMTTNITCERRAVITAVITAWWTQAAPRVLYAVYF